jgi:hypothetical protein
MEHRAGEAETWHSHRLALLGVDGALQEGDFGANFGQIGKCELSSAVGMLDPCGLAATQNGGFGGKVEGETIGGGRHGAESLDKGDSHFQGRNGNKFLQKSQVIFKKVPEGWHSSGKAGDTRQVENRVEDTRRKPARRD